MLFVPFVDSLNIKTIGVMDSRVVLNNSCDDTFILCKEVGCPVADSTVALNNEGAALDTFGETDLLGKSLVASHLADSVVYTKTS